VTTERDRLVERRDLVRRDLLELAAQEQSREVAAATAQRLRHSYEVELDALDAAIADLPVQVLTPDPDDRSGAEPAGRSPWRMVAGSLIVVGALAATVALVARNAGSDDDASFAGLTVDPASVSNEEMETVVAANPDINGMRMALADRYFDAEEYGAALDHYLIIAQNDPAPGEEGKALARVGWIAYRTNLPEAARDYVMASLDVDPTNAEARVYIGFINLYGLGDAEAAIPQLEAALGIPNLSENVISQIEDALGEARNGGSS
jgi:tetratricopeptide (TPR) repeat protein